jgi:hypothetical protein
MPKAARPYFSESSFALAYLSEVISIARDQGMLAAAPVVPTLREERQVGHDAFLPLHGKPVFLQFKLSEVRLKPRGLLFSPQGAKPHSPYDHHYLQFALRPEAGYAQHAALRQLANQGEHVSYIVPDCMTHAEYEGAVIAGRLIEWSREVQVHTMPDIAPSDKTRHKVSFQHARALPGYAVPSLGWRFHSDGTETGPALRGADALEGMIKADDRVLSNEYAWNMLQVYSREARLSLRKAKPTPIPDDWKEGEGLRQELFQQLARSLAAQFGITMLLLGR